MVLWLLEHFRLWVLWLSLVTDFFVYTNTIYWMGMFNKYLTWLPFLTFSNGGKFLLICFIFNVFWEGRGGVEGFSSYVTYVYWSQGVYSMRSLLRYGERRTKYKETSICCCRYHTLCVELCCCRYTLCVEPPCKPKICIKYLCVYM